MKKILITFLCAVLLFGVTGCAEKKEEKQKEPVKKTDAVLENMKKSAINAGCKVNESYGSWDDKIVDGFTVTYPNSHADITTNVFKFENSTKAKEYADKLMSLGYKKVFVKDSYVAPATGDGTISDKYPEEYYDFVENLINNLPLDKVSK